MPREPFHLNVDILISDTKDLLPIKDAMTRPVESVLRAFGEAINTQFREDFERYAEEVETCPTCDLPKLFEGCTHAFHDDVCLCEDDPPSA